MIIPEIVAPAGNFAKLKIALAYGADAVYAGVNNFSCALALLENLIMRVLKKLLSIPTKEAKRFMLL